MNQQPRVRIQVADFDVGQELATLRASDHRVGAVCSFVGTVRDTALAPVQSMELEHYPGMTEKALAEIVVEARRRWQLLGVRVIHRVGRLSPGERIVFVAVSSSHRHDAFAACEFIMDYLKTRAPFWKKERFGDGRAEWVEARAEDDSARDKWN